MIATGRSGWLYHRSGYSLQRSEDGGASWSTRGLLANALQLAADPHDPERLFARFPGSLARSTNGGGSFEPLGLPGAPSALAAFADPFDGDKLYRSSRHGLEMGRWDETAPLDLGPRFEARVRWRDYLGQTGEGRAQALTFDSGLFWIFNPGRAEVSVKVLDGRAINGKFWVFLASMTDVELDLLILDRVTGETWNYHNPLGQLASFGDVEAFPWTERDPAAEAPPALGGRLSGTAPVVTLHGRFEVAIDWSTAGSSGPTQSGAGQGRRLGEETAAFYFFEPANVEVIVNVLDGRGINGKYWVYYGSMSDVEYVVRIKDLRSGLSRSYGNLPGRLASIGDVEAFDE